MATLLVAEHDNKALKDATNKALTAAKAMGADVDVLIAGKDCKGAADAAAKLDGVKKVLPDLRRQRNPDGQVIGRKESDHRSNVDLPGGGRGWVGKR